MKDFETFKQSRMKLDPAAKKLSESQWKQAYAAHRKSLKRVGRQEAAVGESSGSSHTSRRRRKRGEKIESASNSTASRAARTPSAYRESRVMVDTLFWVVLCVVFLSVLVKLFHFTTASEILVAILTAVLQVIGAFFFKLFFHLATDLADFFLADEQTNSKKVKHRIRKSNREKRSE